MHATQRTYLAYWDISVEAAGMPPTFTLEFVQMYTYDLIETFAKDSPETIGIRGVWAWVRVSPTPRSHGYKIR